ncbi:MAG: NAD(P)-binding domain-containing protein, partial [Ramlibacter sp.]
MEQAGIGIVGLGVMGENLALNLERNGFSVSGFDVDEAKRESFALRTQGKRAFAARSLAELVASLQAPRRLLVMVPAGSAVDAVLADLLPLLRSGDVVIDGGNSLFTDTQQRMLQLEGSGILYVGSGVSGGE